MLQLLRITLLKAAIKLALRKPAPTLIPRSLPRAASVDCFMVTLTGSVDDWSLLVDTAGPCGIKGRWLDAGSYDRPVSIPWTNLRDAEFQCTHFLGPFEFEYRSPQTLLLRENLQLSRLQVLRDRVTQMRFNRLRLVRKDRIEMLRIILESSIDKSSFHTSSVTLAANLYTNRLFFHPEREQMLNHCSLLLKSLVASGDLTLKDGAYRLTPKALHTLSQYEEDDRRHRDMLAQQKALKWLTFSLIFVGLLQAYASWKS